MSLRKIDNSELFRANIKNKLDEILKNNMADHYVLDTLVRTASRMGHKNEYMQRYLEVIEVL